MEPSAIGTAVDVVVAVRILREQFTLVLIGFASRGVAHFLATLLLKGHLDVGHPHPIAS